MIRVLISVVLILLAQVLTPSFTSANTPYFDEGLQAILVQVASDQQVRTRGMCIVAHTTPASTEIPAAAIGIVEPSLVALNVPDLEATIAWYCETLGFAVLDRREFPDYGMRIALLKLGGFRLEIVEKQQSISQKTIQDKVPEIKDWDTVHGIKKLGFRVDDLDALVTRLKARQVEFLTGIMGDAADPILGKSVIVLDNSGNWIQFTEFR